MTVEELKQELENCYSDAIVTVRDDDGDRVTVEAISNYDDEVIIEV